MMLKSISIAIIIINAVVFLAEPKTSGFSLDTRDPLNQMLQFTPATAFDMPWTFVTSTFMHADISHFIFNMFALFIFGMFLESRVRPWMFIAVYFLAGIVGNVGYMITAPDSMTPGVGASGAIYGVMGVLGVIAYRAQIYVMLLPIPVPMYIGVIIYAVIEFLGFFAPSNIARGAHLGGLALGVLFGFWLREKIKGLEKSHRVRYMWE